MKTLQFVRAGILAALTFASFSADVFGANEQYALQVDPPGSVVEGGTLTFRITLDRPAPAGGITFKVRATGGTATAGVDFLDYGADVDVTVGNGTLEKTFTVTTVNDAVFEPLESVIISVTGNNGTGVAPVSAGAGSATGSIADNDSTVSIAATTPSVTEGSPITFEVSRFGDTTAALTVQLAAPTGTATSGADYTGLASSVLIAAGATSGNLTINTSDDSIAEGSETVILAIAASAAYTIGTSPATATILDNDVLSIAAVAPSVTEGNVMKFKITRGAVDASAITVNYVVTGAATSGSDYTALPGSIVLPASASEVLLEIATTNDGVSEITEDVIVTITSTSPSVAIGTPTATSDILDNDPQVVRVTTTTPSVDEGQGISFLVERLGDPTAALIVNLAVAGTATEVADYSAIVRPVTILAGADSATASTAAANDSVKESPETVILKIVANAAYSIQSGAGSATSTITDAADRATPSVRLKVVDGQASEPGDDGMFKVVRDRNTSSSITVGYTIDGSATPGKDYRTLTGNVTIRAGSRSARIPVVVFNDTYTESTESVVVTLSEGTGYLLSNPSSRRVSISDDDGSSSPGRRPGIIVRPQP